MNKYKEKLFELYERIMRIRVPYADELRKMVEDLIKDEDLLMVNKKCLPIVYEKLENKQDRIVPMGEKAIVELPPLTEAKFRVGLNLMTIKSCLDYDIKDEKVKREFEQQIAKDLKEDFYYYLENQNTQPEFEEFKVYKFHNGIPEKDINIKCKIK